MANTNTRDMLLGILILIGISISILGIIAAFTIPIAGAIWIWRQVL